VTFGSVVRRVLCYVAVVLVLGLCWWLVTGAVRNLHQSRNLWQYAESIVQLACGVLCPAVVVTRFRWRTLARPLRIAWAATLAATGGISALVWGPPQPHIAALFAAVGLLVAWVLLVALGPALAAAPAGA